MDWAFQHNLDQFLETENHFLKHKFLKHGAVGKHGEMWSGNCSFACAALWLWLAGFCKWACQFLEWVNYCLLSLRQSLCHVGINSSLNVDWSDVKTFPTSWAVHFPNCITVQNFENSDAFVAWAQYFKICILQREASLAGYSPVQGSFVSTGKIYMPSAQFMFAKLFSKHRS